MPAFAVAVEEKIPTRRNNLIEPQARSYRLHHQQQAAGRFDLHANAATRSSAHPKVKR